jgi:hypothetical protein
MAALPAVAAALFAVAACERGGASLIRAWAGLQKNA